MVNVQAAILALLLCLLVIHPAAAEPHAPIQITSNPLPGPAGHEALTGNGVRSGSGTEADPYVVSGWEITAQEGDAIRVEAPNTHWRFTDLELATEAGRVQALSLHVASATIENVQATQTGNEDVIPEEGVGVEATGAVRIDGLKLTTGGAGIIIDAASAELRDITIQADGKCLSVSAPDTIHIAGFHADGCRRHARFDAHYGSIYLNGASSTTVSDMVLNSTEHGLWISTPDGAISVERADIRLPGSGAIWVEKGGSGHVSINDVNIVATPPDWDAGPCIGLLAHGQVTLANITATKCPHGIEINDASHGDYGEGHLGPVSVSDVTLSTRHSGLSITSDDDVTVTRATLTDVDPVTSWHGIFINATGGSVQGAALVGYDPSIVSRGGRVDVSSSCIERAEGDVVVQPGGCGAAGKASPVPLALALGGLVVAARQKRC